MTAKEHAATIVMLTQIHMAIKTLRAVMEHNKLIDPTDLDAFHQWSWSQEEYRGVLQNVRKEYYALLGVKVPDLPGESG